MPVPDAGTGFFYTCAVRSECALRSQMPIRLRSQRNLDRGLNWFERGLNRDATARRKGTRFLEGYQILGDPPIPSA
jgi:hypothetical protein